jgi:hypothetical protein
LVVTGVTADGANYRNLSLTRHRRGSPINIATVDTKTEGFAAFICRDAGIPSAHASCYLEPGDVVAFSSNHKGAGLMLEGLRVTLDFIEY